VSLRTYSGRKCSYIVGTPGSPSVDYLAAGVAQYPPGASVYPAAALASLAAAAAAGHQSTSPVVTALIDGQNSPRVSAGQGTYYV